jgi:hypothetical protein
MRGALLGANPLESADLPRFVSVESRLYEALCRTIPIP